MDRVTNKGHKNRWIGMLFISVSLLIISLDNTILNVALPAISTDLGASASDLQWIVDAYILVFAALLLTMGSIGDRFGRKRMLQFGVFWFGAFSLMAALATSTEMLIASRALLGVGGAMIMPSTLSLITASFRDPRERAQAIALWAATFGLGVGVGPLVGGFLIEQFEWNAVFFVNIPVAIVALIGGHIFLQESFDETAPPPDVPGVLLSITGLFALVYAIIEAGVDGWTAENVLLGFGVAVVALGVFFWWENRARHPMLPLYLFRNMSFTGANVAITLMMFGMFGSMFFMSQYFQSVQGYSALETGWRLLPMALVIMVAAGSSARVAERLGTKITVGLGFAVAAIGMLFLSQVLEPDTPYTTVLAGLFILSSGMGTAMSPATNSIMGSVPVDKAGVGSAMNDTTREVGGALGVAVLGTLMNNTYLDKVTGLESTLTEAEGQLMAATGGQLPPFAADVYGGVENSIQGAHFAAAGLAEMAEMLPPEAAQLVTGLADTIVRVSESAFVSGMTEAMVIASFIMAGAAVFSLAFLPARVRCIEPECEEEGSAADLETASTPVVAGD